MFAVAVSPLPFGRSKIFNRTNGLLLARPGETSLTPGRAGCSQLTDAPPPAHRACWEGPRAFTLRHLSPREERPMSARWQWARHPAFRVAAGMVTAVLAGVAGAVILYQTSVQPGAAIVKSVFERGALVTPPAGFAQVARMVREQRVAVPTPGAPTAYLDIYT